MKHPLVSALLRPVSRLLLRTVDSGDPWRRYAHPVPLHRYGAGACRDFDWYFQGPSRVRVASVDDVKAWVLGCEYRRDPDLFEEVDFWQHPSTFEQLRMGDCEDFALWCWRKLVQLGLEAEFVAGQLVHPDGHTVGHAWVVYRENGQPYLFDPVVRDALSMTKPLSAVRSIYLPECSVDGRFERYVYRGYFVRLGRQARSAA